MKGTKAAPRYAKSLMDLAIEQNSLDRAYADMKMVDDICDKNREMRAVLKSPVIKGDKKIAIIESVFEGRLSPIVSGFIKIITQHRREYMLHEISDSFVKQYNYYKNISVAEITTAVKLSDETRKRLAESLRKSEGREVQIREKVDPSLIGGLIVRIGDRQYDGSISRKLHDLKKEFSNNPYVPSI